MRNSVGSQHAIRFRITRRNVPPLLQLASERFQRLTPSILLNSHLLPRAEVESRRNTSIAASQHAIAPQN